MSSESRKRKLEGGDDGDAMVTTSTSSGGGPSVEGDESASQKDAKRPALGHSSALAVKALKSSKNLALYQNRELGIAIKDYRQQIAALESKVELLTGKEIERNEELSTVRRCWDQLNTDLHIVLARLGAGPPADIVKADASKEGSFLGRLMDTSVPHHGTLDSALEARCSHTKALLIRVVEQLLVSSPSGGGGGNGQDVMDAMHARLHAATVQEAALQDRVAALEATADTTEFELNSAKADVIELTRRLDKAQDRCKELESEVASLRSSLALSSASSGGGPSTGASTSRGGQSLAVGALAKGELSSDVESLTMEIEVLKQVDSMRMQELLKSQSAVQHLSAKLASYEVMEKTIMPSQQVVLSPLYASLYEMVAKMEDEVKNAQMSATRANDRVVLIEAQCRAREEESRTSYERHVTALINDVKNLEMAKAAVFAELEATKARLLTFQANKTTSTSAVEEYEKLTASLRTEVASLTTERNRLQAALNALNATIESNANSRTQSLEGLSAADLASHVTLLGTDLAALQTELENYKAENEAVHEDMAGVSASLTTLQESNARLLRQLRERDDAFTALLSSQVRFKQLYDLLKTEKETLLKKTAVTEAHSRSQTDVIAKLHARIRVVEENAHRTAEEHAAYEATVEALKTTARELNSSLTRTSESARVAEKNMHEYTQRVESQAAEIEDLKFQRRRMEEKMTAMEKEVGRAKGKEVSAAHDAILTETVKALKTLINCSVCKVRTKDVVITKCYHTFCRTCIMSNIEKRNRKCPGCTTLFSVNDVKTVYL